MITYFVITNFRSTWSSVIMLKGNMHISFEMLKEYMFICQNVEGVHDHGQTKVGNP